ncbi:MAG: hypothetical protein IPI41_14995 [Flavobacteriales bacterium]|nr:hypothetical protein [Flavobacteriales bacterium]
MHHLPNLNLFSSLGPSAQAGGQWFKPFMGYAPFGGSVVPSAYPAGGTYSYAYVVTSTPPCTNDTALVTVTYNVAADAGTNDTLITCNSGAAQSLFAQLGGTPMAGGVWTGPSPVAGGMYDPAMDSPGSYLYTVTGAPPCTNSSATVIVSETLAPSAGTNGSMTVCSTDLPQSLTSRLGGIPASGGIWSGPSPVVGVIYDPANMDPGVYTYEVNGTAPCTNASATVTVTESAASNWYADVDGDGTGDALDVVLACAQPAGFVGNGTDPCPSVAFAVPGNLCNDNNAATGNDIYQADCTCAGQLIDCLGVPGGTALIGTACDDGNANTGNDVYDANCVCAGQLIDCLGVPGGTAIVGTSCDDGNANTGNDVYGANCVCAGQLIDCLGVPGGIAIVGTACDDGNANTGNDVYGANCVCAGQLIDCLGVPGGIAIVGTACDDGNANTGNDLYDANCVCAGQLIDCLGVPGGTAIVGTACDDGNANTGNDVYDANCVCAGQLIDCLGVPGGTAIVGTSCDDGNANTGNDVYDANCVCAGQSIDCLGVPWQRSSARPAMMATPTPATTCTTPTVCALVN